MTPESRTCYVYIYRDPRQLWANPETGQEEFIPRLVGKGSGPRDRDHLKETENTTKNRRKFYWIRSLRRQGIHPVIEHVQDRLTDTEAFALEAQLVLKWGRKDYDEGGILLNVTPGGEGATRSGIPLNEEHRQRIGATIKQMKAEGRYNQPQHTGWANPAAVKEKLRVIATEAMTDEKRKRISESVKQAIAEQGSWWEGRHHSEESNERNAEAHRGVVLSEVTRAKLAVVNTGKIESQVTKDKIGKALATVEYEITHPDGHTERILNLRQFCRDHGLNQGNLTKTSTGKLGQHKGYRAKRLDGLFGKPL